MKMKPLLATMIAIAMPISWAQAQQTVTDKMREPTLDAYQGKKIIFVPMSMSFDLPQGWAASMKKEADRLGYKLDIRDANWSTDTGTRAIAQAISEKPDIIVTQNFDISSYSRLLKRAVESGIKVIQINMTSSYPTDAFIGADWVGIGKYAAQQMIEKCGTKEGGSGKIAVVQGPTTAAASVFQMSGISSVLDNNSDVKIVSSQAADWDQSKARAITQTVIQQNPDLCGIIGFWNVMDVGTGAAIKESGKNIYLITSGGGGQDACQGLENGTFSEVISYDVPGQGRDLNDAIKILLASKAKAGDLHIALYTPNKILRKDNLAPGTCWSLEALRK